MDQTELQNSPNRVIAYLRRFGGFVSQMIAPNISILLAWGLMASLFLDNGWIPGTPFSELIRPISVYLIPIMVAFMGGKLIDGYDGGVIAALAAMGLVIQSDVPMFLGAMIMGPISALVNRELHNKIKEHIPKGFEMLIKNVLSAMIGLIMCLFADAVIAPICFTINDALTQIIQSIVNANMLPLLALFNEPAKAVFLNNVIDQGAYYPLGMQEAIKDGKSILFMVASNPGAGLGLLTAFSLFGTKEEKQTAPGALIIHFLGGIHEMYIPYLWLCPSTLLGMILGSASGILVFSFTGVGLTAGPSPGSFFAYMMLTPRHDYVGVILGIAAAFLVSFIVNSFFISISRKRNSENTSDEDDEGTLLPDGFLPQSIVFACDLGLGTSVMGAVSFRKRLKAAGRTVSVSGCSVEAIPKDTDLVITQSSFEERARLANPSACIITVSDFLTDPVLDALFDEIAHK